MPAGDKCIKLSLLFIVLGLIHSSSGWADIIPANNNSETRVRANQNRFNIRAGDRSRDGENLFHSFEDFSLNADQIANFRVDSEVRNVLGRVIGSNPSIIEGLIRITGSNANLYLINPAGIIFGREARLDIPGSFMATTADGVLFGDRWFNTLTEQNYSSLIGDPSAFAFTLTQPGVVLNAGDLEVNPGEMLTLLGGMVINTGTLTAPNGDITIAAIPGENLVRISQDGRLLSLELASISGRDAGIDFSNADSLTPLSLPELLTSPELDSATRVVIDANGVVYLQSSDIKLPTDPGITIVSGTIEVSSAERSELNTPEINVLGNVVALVDAELNASSPEEGGTIRVGGDYQGQETLPQAAFTFVDAESTIASNGLSTSTPADGGTIIVWAADTTQFYGRIFARGAEASNGGTVEVSGAENLVFRGDVDLSAVRGQLGTLLLDPENIVIVDGNGGENDAALNDGEILGGDGAPNATFTISETTLEDLTASITLEATNDIVIDDLTDDRLAIGLSDGNLIFFVADSDLDGVGDFSMNPDDAIQTQGADISISGNVLTLGSLEIESVKQASSSLTLIGDEIDFLGGEDSIQINPNGDRRNFRVPTFRIQTRNADRNILIGDAGNNGNNTLNLTETDLEAIEIDTTNRYQAAIEIRTSGAGNITVVDAESPLEFVNFSLFTQTGAIQIERDLSVESMTLRGGEIDLLAGENSLVIDEVLFGNGAGQNIRVGGDTNTGANLDITLDDLAALQGEPVLDFSATAARITVLTDLQATDIAFRANEINLNSGENSIQASGTVFLVSPAPDIQVNSSNRTVNLDISPQDLAAIDSPAVFIGTFGLNNDLNITVVNDLIFENSEVHFQAPGTLTIREDLSARRNILFEVDEINLLGGDNSIQILGQGSVELQPVPIDQTIVVGGTSDSGIDVLDLTVADLAALQEGFPTMQIGNTNNLGNFNGDIVIAENDQPLIFGDSIEVQTSTGTIDFQGDVRVDGSAFLRSDTGLITIADDLITTQGITLEANEIDLLGNENSIRTNNSFAIRISTTDLAQDIVLNGRNNSDAALDLTTTDLRALGNSSLTFIATTDGLGEERSTGDIRIAENSTPAEFRSPVSLQTFDRGSINIAGDVSITNSQQQDSLTLSIEERGSVRFSGAITVDGNFNLAALPGESDTTTIDSDITARGNIIFTEPITVDEAVQFQSRNGNISFEDIDASNAIALLAENGDISGNDITTSREVTIDAQNNVTINTINAARDVNLNSQASVSISEITTSGELSILAADVVNVETITANGSVALTSAAGEIETGTIDSNAAVTAIAENDVFTNDITAPDGISLTSRQGIVTSGDLVTSASSNSGDVQVIAQESIDTGAIDTSSDTGNAGDVFLDPEGDIEVDSINAEGGADGGDIEVITEQFFRAEDTFVNSNDETVSLSSAGENRNGTITIHHGGGSSDPDTVTEFTVGVDSSSELVNGTTAAITTGVDTIVDESFPGRFTLGDISIRTAQTSSPVDPPVVDPEDKIYYQEDASPAADPASSLEFASASDEAAIFTQDQVQSFLREIEQATDVKPALIYVRFFNPQITADISFVNRETMLTDRFMEYLNPDVDLAPPLSAEPQNDDQLELLLVPTSGDPIRRTVNVTRSQVQDIANQFRLEVSDPRSRESQYLPFAQQLYTWLVEPLVSDLQTLEINNLTFVMDTGLRSIPVAVLHDGNQFLIERYSVGLMPSFSLANPHYVSIQDMQVLAMGASQFEDLLPLDNVPQELSTIHQLWQGEMLLNEGFTTENLIERRSQNYFGIVHLATHANFQAGLANDSYIQFWNDKLAIAEFRELRLNRPLTELLVLSACRTAVGDEQAELGFAGLAYQTGVQSVLASLWYVDDAGTMALMTQFYSQLHNTSTKVEALQQAQLSLLYSQDNPTLAHPRYWSAFTLIGNPW